jgi:hypothetical protein
MPVFLPFCRPEARQDRREGDHPETPPVNALKPDGDERSPADSKLLLACTKLGLFSRLCRSQEVVAIRIRQESLVSRITTSASIRVLGKAVESSRGRWRSRSICVRVADTVERSMISVSSARVERVLTIDGLKMMGHRWRPWFTARGEDFGEIGVCALVS